MIIDKIKINKLNIFIFFLSVFIIFMFILIFKMPEKNTDLKNLNKICKRIEKCNYELKNGINDNSINIDTADEVISNSINNLNDILSSLDNLSMNSERYINQKEDLETALKENIELLELSNNLLNNDYVNINDSFSKYPDKLNSVKNHYTLVKENNLDIVFPDNAIKFYECIYDYANTLIKLSRDSDITFEQNRSFALNIKKASNKLQEISDNLEPVLVDIYENNRSLDNLSKDVKEKKSKIASLKYEVSNYTIPVDCIETYETLKESIYSYEIYITSFENALSNHKNNICNFDMTDIYQNYKDSLSKYNDYIDTFNKLNDISKKINE